MAVGASRAFAFRFGKTRMGSTGSIGSIRELRVVIVDDEPLVREGMRALLDDEPGVRIVGEARNGVEAIEVIRTQRPHVVFLDVQMPDVDGFAVVAALEPSMRPAVVFVTAFDEYAIRAFDVHALDYLLKPFDGPRFRLALSRARTRVAEQSAATPSGPTDAERFEALLAEVTQAKQFADRLLLKDAGSVVVVLTADIEWIEAADNYVKVHAKSGRYMVRSPIKAFEAKLNPARFARAHRSAIVNLDAVRALDGEPSGDCRLTLASGQKITLSRGYRDTFRQRLEGVK